jgi:hypothetical protein
MVRLVRPRRTKGPETDRPHLHHRATSRLHNPPIVIFARWTYAAHSQKLGRTVLVRLREVSHALQVSSVPNALAFDAARGCRNRTRVGQLHATRRTEPSTKSRGPRLARNRLLAIRRGWASANSTNDGLLGQIQRLRWLRKMQPSIQLRSNVTSFRFLLTLG